MEVIFLENFNIDSIKKDIKNTIYNLESKHLTKSNRDKVNKPTKKDQQGEFKISTQNIFKSKMELELN